MNQSSAQQNTWSSRATVETGLRETRKPKSLETLIARDRLAPTSPRTVDRDAFIAAMRGAVTGVNIVTTDGPAGRFGLTVSACASASADPPTVLVCVNRTSPAAAAIRDNGCLCVNVLSTSQHALADTFAGRPRAGARYDFAAAEWTRGATNAPCLIGALAQFECIVSRTVDAGSHVVVFGDVVAAVDGGGSPLLYHGRRYGRPCMN
jgi:flavin reductase (DIM6/NTAB) family NADH-FMN oxidoreductase RutF